MILKIMIKKCKKKNQNPTSLGTEKWLLLRAGAWGAEGTSAFTCKQPGSDAPGAAALGAAQASSQPCEGSG